MPISVKTSSFDSLVVSIIRRFSIPVRVFYVTDYAVQVKVYGVQEKLILVNVRGFQRMHIQIILVRVAPIYNFLFSG